MRKSLVGTALLLGICLAADTEKVDLGALHRIRTEAFGANSRVMDTLFYLTASQSQYRPRVNQSITAHRL